MSIGMTVELPGILGLWRDGTTTIVSERLGFQIWSGDCSVCSKLCDC